MTGIVFQFLKLLATIASGLGKKKKLFILIYHRVLDEPDFMRPGEVDKKIFSWQMALLAKYFNVLPLAEALEKMENNSLPSRAVCITFDDGYADNYFNALPILKQHNLTATFFIATGFLNGGIMWNDKVIESIRSMTSKKLDLTSFGLEIYDICQNNKFDSAMKIINRIKYLDLYKRQQVSDYIASNTTQVVSDIMLTDEQVLQLFQSGMVIGGHTVTHPIMSKTDDIKVNDELKLNKEKLEELIKEPILFFAYPNGIPNVDYTFENTKQVKSVGYQAALSTQWGVADLNSDLYQLPRFTPWDKKPIKFMMRLIISYLK